jgi:hypothetical protein
MRHAGQSGYGPVLAVVVVGLSGLLGSASSHLLASNERGDARVERVFREAERVSVDSRE